MFQRLGFRFSWGIAVSFAAIFLFSVGATLMLGQKYKSIKAESANIQASVFREAFLTIRELSRITHALNNAAAVQPITEEKIQELTEAYDFLFVRVDTLRRAAFDYPLDEIDSAVLQLMGLISLGDQFLDAGAYNAPNLRDRSTLLIDAASQSMMNLVDDQFVRQRDTVEALAILLERSVVIFAVCIGIFTLVGSGLVLFARQQYQLQIRWRKAEQNASFLAQNDRLTRVPNRTRFHVEATKMIEKDMAPMLLICDIDDFQTVNDLHGHLAGDALLKNTAQILKKIAKPYEGKIARLGSDEFAVLLPTTFSSLRTAAICEEIISELATPFTYGPASFRPNVSIGTASLPMICEAERRDVASLQRAAAIALSRAKASGKSTYAFYDADLAAEVERRNVLEMALTEALRNDALSLAYQPQVDMANGKIIGFEALARWTHQDKFISPGEFIPIAEDTGQIIPLDLWCFKTALSQQAAWMSAGYEPMKMSSNFSSAHFLNFDVVEHVKRILDETGVPPELVVMEVTESMAMLDIATTMRILEQLRGLGVVLALDDFGTGYSSLAYLRRLDLDVIKIDQSFVRDMETSDETRMILNSLVDITKGLGKSLVAEGIETPTQTALLREMDIDIGQGYYFGRPVPCHEAEQLVLNSSQPLAAVGAA